MRKDETGPHFPNWRYRDETTFFRSRHLRKFGKNPGIKRDETGLLYTVREIPKQYRISRLFPENLNNFYLGTGREFPNGSQPLTRPGNSQSGMPVLSWDREEDVPECSGPGISRIFPGSIRFLGNGIRERRPLTGSKTVGLDSKPQQNT